MLAEVGYEGITIEAVAQRAGVSKNAIYRRWPDKLAMVLDTLEGLAPAKDHGVDGRLAVALASDMTRHPELAEAFNSRLVTPRRRELEDRVRRAVEAGQLPAGSDVELLTAIGPALMQNRIIFDGTPPDHDYVDRIIRQFWS
jgi:AcrR family transcriptional regulator